MNINPVTQRNFRSSLFNSSSEKAEETNNKLLNKLIINTSNGIKYVPMILYF